jgi:hypothetical protein
VKRALYRLSPAWMLGVMLSTPSHIAVAADADMPGIMPFLCLDGAIEDDRGLTKISVSGGCMVPQAPTFT